MNGLEQASRRKRLWEITYTSLFQLPFQVRVAQSRDHDDCGPPFMVVPESLNPVEKIKAVLPGHDEIQQNGMGAHLLNGSHSPSRVLAKGYRSTKVG